MPTKKSTAERDRERKHTREITSITESWKTVRTLARYALVGIGMWLARDCVIALAGKQTSASFVVALFSNLKFKEVLCISVGAGGIGWASIERWLRKRIIARLGPRAAKWEQSIDAGRTSSRLTFKGETNPTDR